MAKDNRPVISEELAYSPVGGRTKMWALGVGLALVPLAYGVRCVLTGRARYFSLRVGFSFDVSGAAATTMVLIGATGDTVAWSRIQLRAMKAATPPMTMAIRRTRTLLLRISCLI